MHGSAFARPRLADGVELIGEYEGSGYVQPFFLVRRPDGQVVQLSRLLYIVASSLDGSADLRRIAERAAAETGRAVSAANVEYLVEHKLRGLGVAAAAGGGDDPPPPRTRPLLGLTARGAVVPGRLVSAVSGSLVALFRTPVVVGVLACVAVVDAWLLVEHGVRAGLAEALSQPELALSVLGLMVCAAFFHELGHATACRRAGATPGAIGVGIYLVWPVFYSDVTDSYRLSRAGRLQTDLGGLYLNAVFVAAVGIVCLLSGQQWLSIVIVAQHLVVLQQCLPVVRLDGYYVASDLAGVPDLFAYIKPILLGLIPGRAIDPALNALKPRVRTVVAAWVFLTVAAIGAVVVMLTARAPELFATTRDSLAVHADGLAAALKARRPLPIVAGAVEIALLVVALAGVTALLLRIAAGAGRSALAFAARTARRGRRATRRVRDVATRAAAAGLAPTPRRATCSGRAANGGPHRVILGPPGYQRGLRVTGVELYDRAILVRWQIDLSDPAVHVENASTRRAPALTLTDDRRTTYQPLRRSRASTAAIADSRKLRGADLFAPAPPAASRLLRLQDRDRQFRIDLS